MGKIMSCNFNGCRRQPNPALLSPIRPPILSMLCRNIRCAVESLPCLLTVEISVPSFTVADLVHLEPGRIIITWTVGQDVPLRFKAN